MKIIRVTNYNQLPRWLFRPMPGESLEHAVERLRAALGVQVVTVYLLAGRAFIEDPRGAK